MKGNTNMSKIQWTNKISGETGYVKAFSRQMGHFKTHMILMKQKNTKQKLQQKQRFVD